MQLIQKSPTGLTRTLGLLTAALFAGHAPEASAQVADASAQGSSQSLNQAVADGPGTIRVDTAVLFYQEAGSRIQAIEPVIDVTANRPGGDIINFKLTVDAVTGATPNGAAPWIAPQTFITPYPTSTTHTTTSPSGHSTITTENGVATRTYVVPANTLPLDPGFNDRRYAAELGYSTAIASNMRLSVGGSFSHENDYQAITGSVGVSRDLNDKNTTLSLSLNGEFDQSRPIYGTPTPLTEMTATWGGPDQTKTTFGVVAGVTQVMNRHWLAQFSYSISDSQGYQTDPYRFISVVDPITGGPVRYLYESRPDSRIRQSLYFGNKIAVGDNVVGASLRGYHDSWGINSITAEVSDRIPITSWAFLEPSVRFYHQTAANFFKNYLVDGAALPTYASSDSRVGQFNAGTAALKAGFQPWDWLGEFYILGQYYTQRGDSHPADAIGALKTQNLFSGISAASVVLGYSFAF